MAVMDFDQNAVRGAARVGVFSAMTGSIGRFLRRQVAYRNTVAELSQLSDRELLDLGIDRGAIPTIARDAAARI